MYPDPFTDRLSAFVEYGYYDFGTERIRLSPQYSFLPRAFVDIEETANIVRHQSTPGPSVTGPPKNSRDLRGTVVDSQVAC